MRYRLHALLFLLPLPAAATVVETAAASLSALAPDGVATAMVELPLGPGDTSAFTLTDSLTLPRELMRRHPGLRSFRGSDAKGRTVRLDMAPGALRLSLRGPNGSWQPDALFSMTTDPSGLPREQAQASRIAPAPTASAGRLQALASSHGALRYDFRLALAAGSAFVAANGGTRDAALGALVHMANRANEVMENDLGVHLTLAAGTDRLIITDGEGDPLRHGEPRTASVDLVRRRLAANTYDLGHALLGLDGGEAETGTSCSDALDADYLYTHKAAAWSGGEDAESAFANFVLVLGNQLGAPFRDTRCWHCLAFDGASIGRVRQWLASRGGRCAKKQLVDAIAPWIDPSSLAEPQVIPARTPFWLDARVEPGMPDRRLTYAWDDAGFEPWLRSRAPSAILRREVTRELPSDSRWLDARLTVRDNGGATATVASDDTRYQVVDTGRAFAVEPIGEAMAGKPLAVRWDPAGTTLEPLSCHFLDATLSLDGGATWRRIASDIRNNGNAVLALPSDTAADAARLRLACDWRPFFAEAPAPFRIR